MSKTTKAIITRNELTEYSVELPLSDSQIKLLLSKTPRNYVKRRKAKGGGYWDYVSVGYVTKALNLLFGFDWTFEVREHKFDLNIGQAYVLGRLTVPMGGRLVTKEQFGRVDIKFKKGTRDPLDIGNDLKAATSDAMKKCASMLGLAADIYAADDFRDVDYIEGQEDPKGVAEKRFLSMLKKCGTKDEVDLLLEDYENQGGTLSPDAKKILNATRKTL